MANQAINLTVCKCDKGSTPSLLVAARNKSFRVCGQTGASVSDTNFAMPFGVCAVTSSCCAFVAAGPWSIAAPTLLIAGEPTLIKDATLHCAVGGRIDIVDVMQDVLEIMKELTIQNESPNYGNLIIPPNVNIDDNMKKSTSYEMSKYNPIKYTPIGGGVEGSSASYHFGQWVNRVREGGEWDYKRLDRQYENFGNFNYGATGTALGIPESVLLRSAGLVQILSGTSDGGNPLGKAPYGDHAHDQYWIQRGIDYANGKLNK